MSSPVSSLLLLTFAVFWTLCVAEEKHWPDFSCHPAKISSRQRNAVDYNRMGWNSCLEPYEKWNGACPKVCMLLNLFVLVRKEHNAPFILDIDKFVNWFAREVGINMKTPEEHEKKLMDEVRSKMEDCKRNYPEYATLNVKNTPCEPWANVTQCVQKATGYEPDGYEHEPFHWNPCSEIGKPSLNYQS